MNSLTALLEYLLGLFALTVFGLLAFGNGPTNTATWQRAFIIAGGLAAIELAILMRRSAPCNRLILGANIWLIGGAAAFLTKQWWLLRLYESFGELGLIGMIGATGLVTAVASPGGFVAVAGPSTYVRLASAILLAATGLAIVAAIAFRGDIRMASILPLMLLSWLHRALGIWVTRQARSPSLSA